MKQQHSANKSKRKISHDSAHRPQNKAISLPIHCEFMFRAPLQKSNFARRNAIARIIDNRGRSQTQCGVRKNPLAAPKSQKRGLVGACRAPAKCPKCCNSSSVSLMRRKKTTLYSRNTKRFSEKQLDRATWQETVMPDRNNTNQVQRRRFPPEPRHSPCQYGWVLAAATSLLSQKSTIVYILSSFGCAKAPKISCSEAGSYYSGLAYGTTAQTTFRHTLC